MRDSLNRRFAFSLLFIVVTMISNLRFSFMYVYYSLDRDGFIEQLCENKDRPELNCDGKCMLAKMLQAQTDDDERPMPIIGWEEVLGFYLDLPSYNIYKEMEENGNSFYYMNSYANLFIGTLLKPPMV